MSKGHKNFSQVWANQTELGKQFGLSAVAMGKKLKELGLRGEDGTPTQDAIDNEYCRTTPLKDGTPFYMWSRQKFSQLMQSAGHQKLDPQEVKARELTDDWMRVHRQYEKSIHKIEEDLLWEEAQDIQHEAHRQRLTERVNELLQERKFQQLLKTPDLRYHPEPGDIRYSKHQPEAAQCGYLSGPGIDPWEPLPAPTEERWKAGPRKRHKVAENRDYTYWRR